MNTEHNTPLASVIGAARAALADFDMAGPSTVLQTVPPLALTLRHLLDALSSPPADDVREALIEILDKSDPDGSVNSFPSHMEEFRGVTADAILAAFEVRPYGTVTDPSDVQVLAALNATVKPESAAPDLSFWGEESAAQMRASLKAAAEVRERAEA